MGNDRDLVLIKDKNRCPNCRARRSFSGGNCANCGIRLFIHPINFKLYESEGNSVRYWLWTNAFGWIYRDYVINPDSAPQNRSWEFDNPEPNIKTAPEKMAEVRAEARQKIKDRIPKRNVFGFGKSKTSIAR